MADLARLVERLNALLEIPSTPDYPPAHNGLQFANSGVVQRAAAAVDFSARTVRDAAAAGADLLVVHHGMFWGSTQPIIGARYDAIRDLVRHDMAVYAAHLPLDRHPTLGNNVLLAHALGLKPTRDFGRFQTIAVGVSGDADVLTAELEQRAIAFAMQHGGSVRSTAIAEGRRTTRWAIVTGAGASSESLREAAAQGIDTLIVGEGPHHTAVEATDLGLTVIYAGHYATETSGVQALVQLVADEFGIETAFVEAPTGL